MNGKLSGKFKIPAFELCHPLISKQSLDLEAIDRINFELTLEMREYLEKHLPAQSPYRTLITFFPEFSPTKSDKIFML